MSSRAFRLTVSGLAVSGALSSSTACVQKESDDGFFGSSASTTLQPSTSADDDDGDETGTGTGEGTDGTDGENETGTDYDTSTSTGADTGTSTGTSTDTGTDTGTSTGTTGTTGGDYGNCGWDGAMMWYACGGFGSDPNNVAPIECPPNLMMGAGNCLAQIGFEGCCTPEGVNWYCTDMTDLFQMEDCG